MKGGAAALQRGSKRQFLCTLPTHCCTQCELVALSLVAHFQSPPSFVLTDSLNALQLISSWDQRPAAKVLACAERVRVRLFLDLWQHSPSPPSLEKVKAHDEQDEYSPNPRYMDAVQVLDAFRNTGSKMCLLL